jgi:uncharacterized protein
MKKRLSSEICQKCSECCRHYPFVELTPTEINALEKMTLLSGEVFANKNETAEQYFLQFTEDGNCFFLDKVDGGFTCRVYEARPHICRNYPYKPVQKQACAANRKKKLREPKGI